MSSAARRADIQLCLRHRLLVRLRHDDARHAAVDAGWTRRSTNHPRKLRELLHLPIRLHGRRVHVGVLEHCQDEREDMVAVQKVDLEEALGVPERSRRSTSASLNSSAPRALLVVPDAPECRRAFDDGHFPDNARLVRVKELHRQDEHLTNSSAPCSSP